MPDIRLNRLTLSHFKGIAEFTLAASGKTATVRGDNATGKTSLMDAFIWLLFDKDSKGSAKFAIKTLDANGREIHNLDHQVEAEMSIDGQTMTLAKVYREKWTKKRGSASREFGGHVTEYTIDGVPVTKKEYDANVADVLGEDNFRLLADPAYFNSLHWTKRREILMDICGDIADADVIGSSREISDLTAMLGNKSVDELRRVNKAAKVKVNMRLQEIPARIDELTRSIAHTASIDRAATEARIAELDKAIADAKAGDGSEAIRKQRNDLISQRDALTFRRREALQAAQNAHNSKLSAARHIASEVSRKHATANSRLQDAGAECQRLERAIERKREEFKEAAAVQSTADTVCPTCNQSIPEADVQAVIAAGNQARAARLEAINHEGAQLKARLAEAIKEQAAALDAADAAKAALVEADQQVKLTEAETVPTTSEHDAEIQRLSAEIDNLSSSLQDATPDTSGMETERRAEAAKVAALDAAATTQARIAELSAEEKRLAAEYERLEKELHLMERFTVRKVEMLEERINSLFTVARFKLFGEQVNGGIAECCTTLVNGVPYGQGLNHGGEINVGLDIIKTLSAHYGMSAPVWVDNAEAVTRLTDAGTQMIKLVVDETAKKLEVTND